jgi:hypothetical protein
MFKKEIIGKLLAVFGVATVIASLVDLASIMLPLQLRNNQWVYQTVQSVSNISIIPLIGIISFVIGYYLIFSRESNALILLERLSSGVCSLFVVLLTALTLLFSMSINSVENSMVTQIKNQADKVKQQITAYVQQNQSIPKAKLQNKIKEIDAGLVLQVNSVKKNILKNNIKILVNILSYLVAYIIFAVILFNSSVTTRKKLIYEANQR